MVGGGEGGGGGLKYVKSLQCDPKKEVKYEGVFLLRIRDSLQRGKRRDETRREKKRTKKYIILESTKRSTAATADE